MELKDLTGATYLGDGVYIGHDGYAFWLVTYDGMRSTNSICLEPEVVNNLLEVINKFREKK
jgi:hypothetical protein